MHYFHDIPAVTKPIPRNRALLDRDLKTFVKKPSSWWHYSIRKFLLDKLLQNFDNGMMKSQCVYNIFPAIEIYCIIWNFPFQLWVTACLCSKCQNVKLFFFIWWKIMPSYNLRTVLFTTHPLSVANLKLNKTCRN